MNLGHVLLEYVLVTGTALAVQPQSEEERESTKIRLAHTPEAGFVSTSFVTVQILIQPTLNKCTVKYAIRIHERFDGKQRTCREVVQLQHLGLE